jgi:hypothetical protein
VGVATAYGRLNRCVLLNSCVSGPSRYAAEGFWLAAAGPVFTINVFGAVDIMHPQIMPRAHLTLYQIAVPPSLGPLEMRVLGLTPV